MPSWFVKVEQIKERLLATTATTYWVPTFVREKRFQVRLQCVSCFLCLLCALVSMPSALLVLHMANAHPGVDDADVCAHGQAQCQTLFYLLCMY